MSSGWVQELVESIRTNSTFPSFPDSLTVDEAYQVQKVIVAEVANGSLSGLKAGLTSPQSQKAFGMSTPVLGHLYQSGEHTSGVSLTNICNVFIECEIGVKLSCTGEPIQAGPVIELPRLGFASSTDTTGSSVIACNVGSDRYITGEFIEFDNFSEETVRLYRNGTALLEASLADPVGEPSQALDWVLDTARALKVVLKDGFLVITGACGGMHPAEPGAYVADYGPRLGVVEFELN